MGEKIKEVVHWFSDGVDFKEFIALIIISIFGYLMYFACKKMMGIGLVELDIEFLKVISTHLIIILAFYFGCGSAENIIKSLFNQNKSNTNNEQ
jgi:hypothetical protein